MTSTPLLICAALFSLMSCSSPGARAYVGYMQTEMSGSAGLDTSGIPGTIPTEISVDDLGLGGDTGSMYGRVEGDLGLIRVTASGFTYSKSGEGTLSASFGGISASTPVASNIDFSSAKLALSFDIDVPMVRLSPGVQLNYIQLEGQITPVASPSLAESFDEDLPVPELFLQAEVDLDFMGFIVDIAGMDAEVEDVDGTFIDLEAIVYYRPVPMVELMAGYRFLKVDVDGQRDSSDPFLADFEFAGWFIGGGVKF